MSFDPPLVRNDNLVVSCVNNAPSLEKDLDCSVCCCHGLSSSTCRSLTDGSLREKHADPQTLFDESPQMHAHLFPCSQHAKARHTPHHSNRREDIQSKFTLSQSNTGIHNPDNNVDHMMNHKHNRMLASIQNMSHRQVT